jgi:hypothetical protein
VSVTGTVPEAFVCAQRPGEAVHAAD